MNSVAPAFGDTSVSLPIDAVLPEVVGQLAARSSLVVQAATGAGKTTRIPVALLRAQQSPSDRPNPGQIIVVQPRRLAARVTAEFMARQLGVRLGTEVGYHVRFDRQAGPQTRLLVVTGGLLLRQLQTDPFLESVGTVILDEFHERSLDLDLLLGCLKRLQETVRPDLKLVVMSATLDAAPIARFLADCPAIRCPGRQFEVQLRYQPQLDALDAIERVDAAIAAALPQSTGHALVFLPGVGEIRRVADRLREHPCCADRLILPLYSDLPPAEQNRVFAASPQRKLILATNVAETSITVDGIDLVIDTGLSRQLKLDPATGLNRLELGPISKASADQRAGRAGRTGPGQCWRLWSEASQRIRPQFDEPEVRRVDLCEAVLQLGAWGETDLLAFPWFEPPRPDALTSACETLRWLGAWNDHGITSLGRQLLALPAHPRLAKLVLAAAERGVADHGALAAALLSERSPFRDSTSQRPARHRSLSDLIDRVEAIEPSRRGRAQSPWGELIPSVVDTIERTAHQLAQAARETMPAHNTSAQHAATPPATRLLQAIASGFPDRVARRRTPGDARGVMVGGVGVKLSPSSAVQEPELFVCLDLQSPTQGGDAIVRLASVMERDWLPADRLETSDHAEFDERSEKVIARRRLRYGDLVLEESPLPAPSAEQSAEILAAAALRYWPRVDPRGEQADPRIQQTLARWTCLREWLPDAGLPACDEAQLRDVLPIVCWGCRTLADVRNADWSAAILQSWSAEQRQLMEREAPEKLAVPSGSKRPVLYTPGQPPILAVRIQEIFGMKQTPRIARGRVPVLLHLLAPNHRVEQITHDLASFWANAYPKIRGELSRRYPRHAWPVDPLTAIPESRPQRKKPG